MAKELPYFKFEPNQWENGNIQMCSREDKGLFIDICSMYWSRLGDLPVKLALQKLCAGNATALDSLISDGIFEINDGMICISFLNEQLMDFEKTSKTNSKNAKESWEKRREQRRESDRNATAFDSHCENDAIREEKRREEEIREDKNTVFSFEDFWSIYPVKKEKKKCGDKYAKISEKEREVIKVTISDFVKFKPFPSYNHPNPLTYLNGKRWEDEITRPESTERHIRRLGKDDLVPGVL